MRRVPCWRLNACCAHRLLQVTNDNKREYVNLVARHRMTTAIRGQIEAFLKVG